MALTVNHPLLKEQTFQTYYSDVSTAGSAFIYVPFRGKVVKVGSVLHSAITVANAAVTSKINGTAITGGALTIAYSGSAAGDVDTAVPTGANSVVEGDYVEFASDGGSTTAAPMTYFVTIQAD